MVSGGKGSASKAAFWDVYKTLGRERLWDAL